MKYMKLGVTYNLFNGEELLRASILSIREHVDYINVVWQEVSWTLEHANPRLKEILDDLKQEKLVDKIIEYKLSNSDPRNERCKKMNIGIKDLKRAGMTHFLLMDADEFYDGVEFENAKKVVGAHGITHSVCSIFDYRLSPKYRMRDIRDYCVGFIFKLTPFSYVLARKRINNMPCHIDPFRTVPFSRILGGRFYYLNCISMHHMTGIRNDYDNKMKNTISIYSEEGKKAIEYYSKLQKRMNLMSEKEILEAGYILVEDKFQVEKEMELFNRKYSLITGNREGEKCEEENSRLQKFEL